MSYENLTEFLEQINKFKHMPRTGWVWGKVKNPETVASHSFGVAVTALILAEKEGKKVDTGKIVKMSLIHDLAEVLTGDMTPFDEEYKNKESVEAKKLEELVRNLPEGFRKEMRDLFSEFAEGRTEESKIVRAADKLDMVFTAWVYEKKQNVDLNRFFNPPNLKEFKTRFTKDFIKYLKDNRKK